MDLEQLYQDLILDHFKNPRNQGEVSDGDCLAEAVNPTCGDQIRLTASAEGDRLQSVRYHAKGCAICVASASMMSEYLPGHSLETAGRKIVRFKELMKGEEPFEQEEWGKLVALQSIRRYPMRIKCATLGWNALAEALEKLR